MTKKHITHNNNEYNTHADSYALVCHLHFWSIFSHMSYIGKSSCYIFSCHQGNTWVFWKRKKITRREQSKLFMSTPLGGCEHIIFAFSAIRTLGLRSFQGKVCILSLPNLVWVFIGLIACMGLLLVKIAV